MQAIPAFLSSLGTVSAGLSGAAAGATAGVSAASAASLGTALQVGGAVIGGLSQLSMASYQAAVAERNAEIAEQNRQLAIDEGQREAQEKDREAVEIMGQMLANQGASGLAINSGSFGLARKSAAELAARDRGYIRFAAEGRARNFANQANDFRSEASMSRSAGRFGALGSFIDGTSSLISGAAKVNKLRARSITA